MPCAVEAVPTTVMAALSAGEPDTFWLAPKVTMLGAIATVRLPVPSAVPSAVATNWCSVAVTALVSGCTRNTPAMVKMSPLLQHRARGGPAVGDERRTGLAGAIDQRRAGLGADGVRRDNGVLRPVETDGTAH